MSLKELETLIDYSFNNNDLINKALIHKSFDANNNNERLEYLGDSILNSVISEHLYLNFLDYQEGLLTRARAKLVQGSHLTLKASEIGLDKMLQLSKGMKKLPDERKSSILEGAFEALIGAIFIDGGWVNVKKAVLKIYQDDLNNLSLTDNFKDPKSILQEFMQAQGLKPPSYNTIELKNKTFESSVNLKGIRYVGVGNSKKVAEANLAEEVLKSGDII